MHEAFEQMTPAPSSGPQSSFVRCGQSRRDDSLPLHSTLSIAKRSGTAPKRDWMVCCPERYPSILQTTAAFSASWPSSQTGSPPTNIFPSWDPDPPTSFTSETQQSAPGTALFQYVMQLSLPQKWSSAEVSESHFFILETRMRVSLIQSRTSRRDREFLTLNLRLRDETEKKSPPISGIETRSRFIIFILRLRDENENSLDLISVFETRTRILKVAILPWIQASTACFACNFWEAAI